MKAQSLLSLPLAYLSWHYTVAWRDIVRLYRNLAWFLWNFFSVPLLAGTLLAPWKRLHEGSRRELGGFLGSFILNLILRVIGIFARMGTILCGLAALALLSLFFIAFVVLWPFMPLIIIVLILNGAVIIASF